MLLILNFPFVHTKYCIVLLTQIHFSTNLSSSCIFTNRKIPLNLKEYMMHQHNRSFTDYYRHVNHALRTRQISKGCSFWPRPGLYTALCVICYIVTFIRTGSFSAHCIYGSENYIVKDLDLTITKLYSFTAKHN